MSLLGWALWVVMMSLGVSIIVGAVAVGRLWRRTAALREIADIHISRDGELRDPDYWYGLREAADIAREALGLPSSYDAE